MTALGGVPTEVKVGPGILRIGSVGAAEPADLTAPWDAAWVPLGYTAEGHAFNMSPSFEPITVAEELDTLRHEATGRTMNVSFAAAQMTARNLSLALNGGTIDAAGIGFVTFEPPDPGEEVRIALGWESTDGSERSVWRKCLQTGDVEIARRKAPATATIPMTFMLEVVAGKKPFRAIFEDAA